MKESDFNVFVGAETGFVKGVNLNTKHVISKNFKSTFPKNDLQGVASLFWSDPSNEEEIVIGFQNKKISVFDTTSNIYTSRCTYNFGEGPLVTVFKKSGLSIAALNSGEIGILQGPQPTIINTIKKTYEDRNVNKSTLTCAKPNDLHPSEFATGGCENDLSVWDMNKQTRIFQAKNVKADMLDLRVPIWITDLTYLTTTNLIALSTRHKQVRLYDPKTQRRPIMNFEFEDNPLTSIAPVPSFDKQIVIGTSNGRMALFDLRKATTKSPLHVYKGFVGSVRDISVHETLPLIFSVSLDRYLRVHHLHDKNMIYKHSLKSRLTCLLVRRNLNESDFSLGDQLEEKPTKKRKVE